MARISLSPTPCLVHLSQGRPEGQECDPPHISQGSNEPHIVPRLGTRRSSWALLAVLPPAALQAYRVTPILGQRGALLVPLRAIISDLSLPCLPVAMFSLHTSLSVIHSL